MKNKTKPISFKQVTKLFFSRLGMSCSRKVLLVAIIAICPFSNVTASTPIIWAKTVIELNAIGAPLPLETSYQFKNNSDSTVEIKSVLPACDCIAVEWTKGPIHAGGTGEIKVKVFGDFRNTFEERTILVTTSDERAFTSTLVLRINGNPFVTLSAQYIVWARNGPSDEKAIEVKLANPASTTIKDAQCSETSFSARLQHSEDGHHYLLVRPTDTARLEHAPIRIEAVENGVHRTFVVYAIVK